MIKFTFILDHNICPIVTFLNYQGFDLAKSLGKACSRLVRLDTMKPAALISDISF